MRVQRLHLHHFIPVLTCVVQGGLGAGQGVWSHKRGGAVILTMGRQSSQEARTTTDLSSHSCLCAITQVLIHRVCMREYTRPGVDTSGLYERVYKAVKGSSRVCTMRGMCYEGYVHEGYVL